MSAIDSWVSRLRARAAMREEILRSQGSWRWVRMPQTTSQPSRQARSPGISAGSFCRSASRVTTTPPRAERKPAARAADWPVLRCRRTIRTAGFCRASWQRASKLPSVLPSSTKITSWGRPRGRRTPWSSAARRGRFFSSLNTGMTTEISGGGTAVSYRPPPKTLITPALFSRPRPTPHTGRRGRQVSRRLALPSPSPGVGGWAGAGEGARG